MAGTLYDHMIAVVIVGAIFATAVAVIPNVSYVNLLYVDQQQLRNVALEVLKAMFLETGYPSNWGSSSDFNSDAVKRFGLAFSNSSSLYVLDPDKVERLVAGNPLGCLKYETVHQLLRLEGYDFSLRITAPFNVTVIDLSDEEDELEFDVTVTFNDKKPVPNAVVNAFIVYSYFEKKSDEVEQYSIRHVQVKGATKELGKCLIQYTIPPSEDAKISHRIAIFQITVADVATVTTVYVEPLPNNIAVVNVLNDELILTQPDSIPKDARWIENLAVLTKDGLMTLYNGTQDDKINWGTLDCWSKNFHGLKSMDPILLIANVNAVEKATGRRGFLVVGPYPNYLGSRVIDYGHPPLSQDTSVRLQRSVNISGMTHIAELTLWKRSS